MKKKQVVLFIIAVFFCAAKTFAQNGLVSVNTLTGAPNIVIPIDEVRKGALSAPVSLVYSSSGIKPKDVEGTAGMGWQLQAGGQVTRVLRGLPDDVKKDQHSKTSTGWIYNTNQSKISTFNIANIGTTCTYETTDINYLNTNFSYSSDTEPDLFYVNAPGLSCQLVWDQSLSTPGFRTIPYKDYIITPAFDPTTGLITSFTILNDQGIKYIFSAKDTVRQTAIKASDAATVNYFTSDYDQYANGIVYNSSWHLNSMTDPNGNGIGFTYQASAPRTGVDDLILWGGGTGGTKTRLPQYGMQQTVTEQTLVSIGQLDEDGISQKLTFTWQPHTYGSENATNQTVIQSITGVGKNYNFTYSDVTFSRGAGIPLYGRLFLRSFSDDGCSSPVNYKFAYSGETVDAYGSIWSTVLSDSTSTHIDYWGYYNSNASTDLVPAVDVNASNTAYPRYTNHVTSSPGTDYANAISGTNRSASLGVTVGSLTKIYYAQGGNSTIVYEPNDYLDVPSNTTIQGGGVRVKQLIDSAVNSPLTLVRNYSYKTTPFLSTSASSGEPVSLPQYAFTTPYTGSATGNDYWSLSTIRSETDLSPEDHTIMYNYVRESKTGAGSTLYQFYVPAGNWDNTATPACTSCAADWSPTTAYSARTDCAVGYGPVANLTESYPFAPNTNYDFERGLPLKVTNYDDDNVEVSETSYTYQRTSSPSIIPALAIDTNANSGRLVRSYSKYNVYASAGELTSTVTKKVFDLNSATVSQTSSINYTYNTTQHKLKKQAATNSDGSTVSTTIQYAKDFTTTGSNADVTAIAGLKAQNNNVPIETYQQVTRGGTTTTTAATLTRFKAVTIDGGTTYLPLQQLKFFSADGDAVFTPYSITSGVPASYTLYQPAQNFLKYDNFGNLMTTDDAHKHTQTVITNYISNAPEAIFAGAAAGEIAFSDFDSYYADGITFLISGTPVTSTTGSHNGAARNFSTAQNFSKTLTKNPQAVNYLFSAWINAPTGTNTLTFVLTGGATTSTYAKTYTGTGAWKYYQFTIPVSNMSASFSISLTTGVNIVVDDLLFYPENAEVTTYAYDPLTRFKAAQTNTNGVSAYYNYDQWGRLIYAYDQDKNIVQKNTFILPSDLQYASTPEIGFDGTRYVNMPMTFETYGYNACTGFGISSVWNFGDGTGNIATSSMSQVHTYTATGTYTVTLTTTSPVFGTKTVTTTITITNTPTPPPGNIVLSYDNHTSSRGDIASVTFDDGVHTPVVVSAASLDGYVLAPGTYTIQVAFASGSSLYNGTSGYACINLSSSCSSSCQDFNVHNTYTFAGFNLTTCATLNFSVNIVNCATLLD